ncbi:hypothetical protein [Arcanobacterium bovis]|uniref:Uncharacterized protein n=1 Tax=Arcanobacterium bovis TaxID=2529275 RepID=A0A4V2KRC7_9ACTO|nr:hypothetical protein [Arcanobacterium bovis]TBW23784.1 hypothetical protein EZJ44_01210 [Arcanobacterium bovis]
MKVLLWGWESCREDGSGRRLDPPFDLTGWQWVEAWRDDVQVLVNLQSLDKDPNSGDVHALVDRISVEVNLGGKRATPRDPLVEQAPTAFELPLSEEDLEELVRVVLDDCKTVH